MKRKKSAQRHYLCHAGFNHFRAFERTTRAEQFDDVFLRDVAMEVAHQNTEALERGKSREVKKNVNIKIRFLSTLINELQRSDRVCK